ncbi:hypothetical protein V5O48_009331 [Marasmius crinis-equi]|uniref:Ferritin-like domain-containing protein n=1 Tax=Marasmius crinis-equi TaxID=585013 RepID=A0ABR3FBE8_9AGAR
MKFSVSFFTLSVIVPLVVGFAVPLKRSANVTDADVLNFALTLEHLENTFYHQGLANFSEEDFAAAGFSDQIRGRFSEIAQHEQVHVDGITAALTAMKASPVQPCTYNFPYTDLASFVALGNVFETVGSSAYSGAASFVSNKGVLTVAATILAIEARHSSWLSASALNANPWSGAFEVALTPNQVFTLASSFITSCPSTNAPLPATANPPLTFSACAKPGQQATLEFTPKGDGSKAYLVFQTSDGPISVDIADDQTATLPSTLMGTVFAFVSSAENKTDDASVIAGPALLMFPFNAQGELIEQA